MGVRIPTADAMALAYERAGNVTVNTETLRHAANAFDHVAGRTFGEPQETHLFDGTNFVFNGGQLLTGVDLSQTVANYHGWTSREDVIALTVLRDAVADYGPLNPFEMGSLIYNHPNVAAALVELATD